MRENEKLIMNVLKSKCQMLKKINRDTSIRITNELIIIYVPDILYRTSGAFYS